MGIEQIEKELREKKCDYFITQFTSLRVPLHLVPGLARYCGQHVETGGFLRKVLENNLHETIKRADPQSFAALPVIIDALLAEAPEPCWGSKEKVEAWIQEGSQHE